MRILVIKGPTGAASRSKGIETTMKMAMTALALVFLAQASLAQAQSYERDGRDQRERQEPDNEPRQREFDAPRPERVAPPAREAPPAAEAPQARQPREGRGSVPGDAVGRPGPWTPNAGRGEDRRDRSDGQRGEGRRDEGRRDEGRRDEGHRDDDARRGERRGGQHWDNDRDRHEWGGRDWDDRRWRDRDRDGRFDRDSRWERGRYPSVYSSSNRYRYAWRPPSGFYVRSWGFGDFLPRSWFGSGYWISDPWRFNLPRPPLGYDWVRAGDDALLIDQFTGRIVQVVRNIFW